MSDKKGETGSAGAIREAGGAFGKMEIAHEEEYFYKQVKLSLLVHLIKIRTWLLIICIIHL